jgi:hypothetical protein
MEPLRAEGIFKFLDAHNLILRRRSRAFLPPLLVFTTSRELIIVFKMKFMAI